MIHRHRLTLNDARRFGSVDLVDEEELASWPPFAALGPEPLGPGFTAQGLRAATKGRKPAIKLLLLDQRVVAGLGNIYVCEALWRARIDPRKPGAQVTGPQLERLVPAIREVLEQSIADGGSTLRDSPGRWRASYSPPGRVYCREGHAAARGDGVINASSRAGAALVRNGPAVRNPDDFEARPYVRALRCPCAAFRRLKHRPGRGPAQDKTERPHWPHAAARSAPPQHCQRRRSTVARSAHTHRPEEVDERSNRDKDAARLSVGARQPKGQGVDACDPKTRGPQDEPPSKRVAAPKAYRRYETRLRACAGAFSFVGRSLKPKRHAALLRRADFPRFAVTNLC